MRFHGFAAEFQLQAILHLFSKPSAERVGGAALARGALAAPLAPCLRRVPLRRWFLESGLRPLTGTSLAALRPAQPLFG